MHLIRYMQSACTRLDVRGEGRDSSASEARRLEVVSNRSECQRIYATTETHVAKIIIPPVLVYFEAIHQRFASQQYLHYHREAYFQNNVSHRYGRFITVLPKGSAPIESHAAIERARFHSQI